MALKSIDILKQTLSQKNKHNSNRLERNKARATIEDMCDNYLKSPDDVLTFEVLPNALDSVLSVIEIPPLSTKYDIMQMDETLFQISLKEIDIL